MNSSLSSHLSSETTVSRVALWDNAKFLMIVLMTIGHFADVFTGISDSCKSIYLCIYAFHMPLLIFISGLFYSNKDSVRKMVYYISCGFALKFALFIAYYIMYKSKSFSLLSDGSIPWFMFSLAAFQFFMLLFKRINKIYLLFFSIFLACFVGYDKTIGDYLYLSRTIIFFPFFLLGTMINQEDIVAFIKRVYKCLLPISIIVLVLWIYVCFFQLEHIYYFRHLFTGRNPFSDQVVEYGFFARLLCYCISFLTGWSLLVIIPKYSISCITAFGRRTLNVYFWHWPLYLIMDKYLKISTLFALSVWGKVLFLLIAILLSMFLMYVRVFDYPLVLVKMNCFEKN